MKLNPVLVLLTLLAVPAWAEPSPARPTSPPSSLRNNQLVLRVEQEAVAAVKGADRADRVNALRINVQKSGQCDGKLTIKAYFVAKDVATNDPVIHSVVVQEGEAVAGTGNTYVLKSKPFHVTPAKPATATTKAIPATGGVPIGWLVQISQNGQLITTRTSSQGYEGLAKAYEADTAAAKVAAVAEAEKSVADAEKTLAAAQATLTAAKAAVATP